MWKVLVCAESRFCTNEGVGKRRLEVSVLILATHRGLALRCATATVNMRDIATKVLLLLWENPATSSHDLLAILLLKVDLML